MIKWGNPTRRAPPAVVGEWLVATGRSGDRDCTGVAGKVEVESRVRCGEKGRELWTEQRRAPGFGLTRRMRRPKPSSPPSCPRPCLGTHSTRPGTQEPARDAGCCVHSRHPTTWFYNWKRDIVRAKGRELTLPTTGPQPERSCGPRLGSEQHRWLGVRSQRGNARKGLGRIRSAHRIMLPLNMTAPDKAEAITAQRVAPDIHRHTQTHTHTPSLYTRCHTHHTRSKPSPFPSPTDTCTPTGKWLPQPQDSPQKPLHERSCPSGSRGQSTDLAPGPTASAHRHPPACAAHQPSHLTAPPRQAPAHRRRAPFNTEHRSGLDTSAQDRFSLR